MKKMLLGAALAVACPSVAHAQDGSEGAWSGFYFGAEAGVDNYELSADTDIADTGFDASFDGISGDGVAGGVFAGYHMGFTGGFLAVEGFAGLSDASMGASISDGVDTFSLTAKAKESYGIAARLGAKVSRSTAVYVRGGWINTKFKVTLSDGVDTLSESETEDGFQYGAGMETMVGANIALRAEYVISDYSGAGLGDGVSLDNGSFRAGISLRY
ncbi:outer membrane protein [Erythrobacter mangrovi]|uniref:Porin family protein n=1 Tax=Erythrobacter mangrovi TaxID=2739433 RepID=A0A7D3Y0M1_9SPHN|nr:outer membrane beta-barrel protein [Erythrobacter mangrovi]QKG71952.1 porin family protein [Erythrobacter mangrovi]